MSAVSQHSETTTGVGTDQSHIAPTENPVWHAAHRNLEKAQASRPDWHQDSQFHLTKTPNPAWKLGDGANDGGESLTKKHIEINPYEVGRPSHFNYKLLISGIVPRPIGFLSTRSRDVAPGCAGESTNLAPFSYTNLINHDPPLFTIGFAGSLESAKDSLRNLKETGECTINIISEHFLEAANATAINAPYGVSEWALTGLTPAPCTSVSCARVKESIFSIEAVLVETRTFKSRTNPDKTSSVLAIVEGVNFWVREDAINEDRNMIDFKVLRPVSRLGGIMYGRTVEGFELPRLDFEEVVKKGEADGLVREKA